MWRSSLKVTLESKSMFQKKVLTGINYPYEGSKLKYCSFFNKKLEEKTCQEYPNTEQILLPPNIETVASTERLKFSPQRNRDISGSFISNSVEYKTQENNSVNNDMHECYDCSGAINLSSSMQTNVPQPFKSKGKPTHLNMPGGQWQQKDKFLSEDLNNFHHSNTQTLKSETGGTCSLGNNKGYKVTYYSLFNRNSMTFSPNLWFGFKMQCFCDLSTQNKKVDAVIATPEVTKQISLKEKFKKGVKEYGIVIVFAHISISLLSLGICYLAVSSGITHSNIFKHWGLDEGAATVGTATAFIISYAIHKSIAPGRFALSVMVAPIIVKKLRKIGLLKIAKTKEV